jgi:hypothetical protein
VNSEYFISVLQLMTDGSKKLIKNGFLIQFSKELESKGKT